MDDMDEPPVIESVPPSPAVPQPPRMSLPARLLNVFAVPGDVFAEVKATRPSAANWLVPALLFVIVGWIAASMAFSQAAVKEQLREVFEKDIQKKVEKGQIAEKNREQALQATMMSVQIGSYASPLLVAAASPFWWGLILWLVGTRILKGSFPFMKAVEVSGLAGMIGVLEAAVKTLLVIGFSNPFASPSLAALMKNPDPQNPTFTLLNFLDIMMFWALVVRAIGLSRLAGAPFVKSAFWIFGIWAVELSLMLGVGFAARSAFGGG